MNTPRNLLSTLRLIIVGLLTGIASRGLAQQVQTLYATPGSPSFRDSYTGAVGCHFQVGSSNVVVSHLGYFSTNTSTGLAVSHYVGIFDSGGHLLTQVIMPAGLASDYYTNDFYWMPLDPPYLLNSNGVYFVAALAYNGDGDWWGNNFTPTWNTYFVGSQATSTRYVAYGPGNSNWPTLGGTISFGNAGGNQTYCAEGLANLPIDHARVGVQTTNAAFSSGQTVAVMGFATGQSPINYQWWMAPNTPLANQTNAILTIPNASIANSGTYYLTASNALGGEQSSNVVVSVTAFPVGFSKSPTNTTVLANYPVTFSCVVTGTPPISLQWLRNGNPVSGATNSSYSFFTTQTNNGDIYSCFGSNYIINPPASYTATSGSATLTLLPNQAYPQEYLHGDTNVSNNTFQGLAGGEIVVGNTPMIVTHLGYYAWPANRVTNGSSVTITYTVDHHVGIYYASGYAAGQTVPAANLLGSVDVPAATLPVVNGYAWVPLDPPLVLSSNTTYLLMAETKSDQDWGNTYAVADLNPFYATSCAAYYSGASWGANVSLNGGYGGQLYSAPNLATLALTNPSALVWPTNLAQPAGTTATLTAYAEGQAPVTLQWFKDGNLLAGQTNSTLTIPFLQNADAGNYYVIVTNTVTSLGATSTLANVTVEDMNEPLSLYVGGSGTLSVPSGFSYQWVANGTAIGGAHSSSYTFAANGGTPTNFYCIATNGAILETSAVWSVTVVPAPTAPYPASVLAANPMGYWRLNETDPNGNSDVSGLVANDYWRGNYGIYSNADLGQAGYNTTTDPSETAAQFGIDTLTDGDVYGIGGIDFSAPTNSSVGFSVEAWVNAYGQSKDAGIVSKGFGGGGEQFDLDTGGPTNATQSTPHNFRFLVRDAAGGVHTAASSIQPNGVWHHLVGVCDEANSNVTLYVDGVVAAQGSIPSGSGILSSTRQMLIGSRPSGLFTDNDDQFVGTIDDVSVYNYALSASNVDYQYAQAGVAPNFIQSPPASISTNDGAMVTIPAILVGTPPMTYTWADVNNGTNVATGSTNGTVLNAALTVKVPLAWNGDTLQLTVNNGYGAPTFSVSLTVFANAPQITQDIQPQTVYVYQPVQFTVGASGTAPLSYQWTFGGNPIPGATNATLNLTDVTAANAGNYQVIVTNSAGMTNSSVAALTVVVPPANTYDGSAMSPDLLLYYSFEDAGLGNIATNQGSLGFADNGTYEGGYSSVAGPTGFSNFDPANLALGLDGFSADMLMPSISTLTLSNCTIAAWVYGGGGQPDNTAIFFHRQTSVFGMAVGNNIFGAANWLKYTWNDDPATYNTYTGLVLPTNQWAFVAMVISPTNSWIYLQDGVSMKSTNFVGTYPPQDFSGVSYVGWDTAGGNIGRRWTGNIDDVMVFDQALSPSAINSLFAGVPPAQVVMLNLSKSGGNIVLSWPSGTLEEATSLTGPWVTNSAASPYTNTPNTPVKFYRVQVK